VIEKIKNLPPKPGIYQYFDKNGKLLYIGKAKSLKNRVKNYFKFTPSLAPSPNLGSRIYKMVSEVADINYILTQSENDALILENSLIKQLKPKYNILLRDDKTYPYIYIDLDLEFPRFEITRKVIKGAKIKYFGPFATGGRDLLDSLYEIFPLVQKKGSLKNKKLCLFYQIKKCLGPCEAKVSKEEYMKIINEAMSYINNKNKIIQSLKEKMLNYANNLQFEEADVIKKRIQNIEKSSIISGVDLANNEDFDLLAIANNQDKAITLRLFIRGGKVVSSSHFSSRFSFGFDKDEAYKRAMLEFYTTNLPITSNTVYVYEDFIYKDEVENLLSKQFEKKFKIIHPKRGKKHELCALAFKNANELLRTSKQKDDVLLEIKELFNLERTPFKIEVFDNSHLQGRATVGAMVVFEDDRFKKEQYRHYNLTNKDEYHQMKELLSKRAESFEKSSPPDLWVIDGGETLRRLAIDVLQSIGVSIDVIAISKEKLDFKAHRSKGSAKDIIYTKAEKLNLQPSDKRLQFIQRLRDEAHRFAIEFHRKQKLKEDKKISLLEISGISHAKIKKLINYFGTFENIKKANFEELLALLNNNDASKIKEYFDKS